MCAGAGESLSLLLTCLLLFARSPQSWISTDTYSTHINKTGSSICYSQCVVKERLISASCAASRALKTLIPAQPLIRVSVKPPGGAPGSSAGGAGATCTEAKSFSMQLAK